MAVSLPRGRTTILGCLLIVLVWAAGQWYFANTSPVLAIIVIGSGLGMLFGTAKDEPLESEISQGEAKTMQLLAGSETLLGVELDPIEHSTERFEDHLSDVIRQMSVMQAEGELDGAKLRAIERILNSGGTPKTRHTESELASELNLQPGSQVGEYRLLEEIARGGIGVVFKAESGDQMLALKFLTNAKLTDRFHLEMELVQRLAHPNIVVAYGHGDYLGFPFLAMELLEGPDLSVFVSTNGPVDWQRSVPWIVQAIHALDHAHRRDLYHRDVKPGNLLLHQGNIKLADLGLATANDEKGNGTPLTDRHALFGTPEFMSPEQARSLNDTDERSDIYSLGATWFFLLTGKVRVSGTTLNAQLTKLLIDKDFERLPTKLLPEPGRKIMDRMLAYDPADRYQDCQELLDDFVAWGPSLGHSYENPQIDVLIVEDNEDDLLFTTRVLGKMNRSVQIEEAHSLRGALEVLNHAASTVDIVLLDLQLPDSKGLETVQGIRSANAHVPVIVLTGHEDPELRAECIEAGANEFTSKNTLDVHTLERVIFVTLSQST